MSDDLLYIIRSDAHDGFCYSRHGGSYIDRVVMSGPEGLLDDARLHRPGSPEHLSCVLSGIALMDQPQQTLWFYSSQQVLRTAWAMRAFLALVQPEWPGWSLRPMTDPVGDIGRLLPQHPLERHTSPPRSLEDFAQAQQGPWQQARASHDDIDALIAESGEGVVRSWFESDHRSVAVIDGHEVTLDDGILGLGLLRVGAQALPLLRSRPRQPLADTLSDGSIHSAYWIDTAQRRLEVWNQHPLWSPLPVAVGGWPGWQIDALPGGVITLMQRLGQDPRTMLEPSDLDAVRTSARYLLTAGDTRRWQRLEEVLQSEHFTPMPSS